MLPLTGWAQWQPNGATSGNIYYLGGNVGIGTNNPPYKTVISNGGAAGLEIDPTGLQIQGGIGLQAYNRSTSTYLPLQLWGSQVILGGGNTQVIGNVGIGVTGPTDRLHIDGDIRLKGSSRKLIVGSEGSPSDYLLLQDVGSGAAALQWVQDGAAKFSIDGVTGNVGIGLGSAVPTDKLHIDGDIRLRGSSRKLIVGSEGSPSDYLLLQDVGAGPALQWVQDGSPKFNIEGVTGNVGIGTVTPVSKLHVADGAGGEQIRMSRGTGSVRFAQDNNQDNLYLFNGDGSKTFMFWKSDGNVGIGNMNPDAKLAVSGQVHATEVRVTTTVPGPDYVFEKDYKLTSLDEIKNYIDQNKHLPEVPSAKEMEKNGVQLGEMNMLLLKKIEELTLYVIEQQHQIKEQTEKSNLKIESLEKEITLLKNKSHE
jgi:hypothetical protein